MPAKVGKTGRLRKWLGRLVLAVIVLVLLTKLFEPALRRTQLLHACASADRLVVDFNTWPEDVRAKLKLEAQPTYDIRDREAIQKLLGLLRFQVDWMNGSCRCYGDVVFRFCRGEQTLASVSLHHDKNLRWRDGAWWGDATLVAESRTGIDQWLKDNHVPFRRSAGDITAAENETRSCPEPTPTTAAGPVGAGAQPGAQPGAEAANNTEGAPPPG
ncbi:MAG TPA: hypothetical protein PKK06_16980 [Phycisphaerae bacterium]|nr:hypothetical protein [Phycisphaerae bacterium]HNU46232.1 hypothetical protein [Phycisphaerae bacterium]